MQNDIFLTLRNRRLGVRAAYGAPSKKATLVVAFLLGDCIKANAYVRSESGGTVTKSGLLCSKRLKYGLI